MDGRRVARVKIQRLRALSVDSPVETKGATTIDQRNSDVLKEDPRALKKEH
jgi:hypothetical protein